MSPFIAEDKLKNLNLYKYSAVDESVLSNWFLNSWWSQLVLLVPKTTAPNTITSIGLMLVLSNLATLLVFDPSFSGRELPSWAYFSFAANLFAFQTLDAIDGKQARRTGMSGPLGEMFDHGCDALITTLEVNMACHALNIGRSWRTVAFQVVILHSFYLGSWEEYYTGTLNNNCAFSGAVEGILVIVGLYIITGIYGPQVWDLKPAALLDLHSITPQLAGSRFGALLALRLSDYFMLVSLVVMLYNASGSYTGAAASQRKAGKSSYTPLLGLLPFAVQTSIFLGWLCAKPEIIHSPSFLPFLVFWGLTFAYQLARIILAYVTKQDFPFWSWMTVWSLIGMLDASMNVFGGTPFLQTTPERTLVFISYSVALAVVAYGILVFTVINQITEYTGIACFTVRKKDKSGEWVEASKVDAQKSQ